MNENEVIQLALDGISRQLSGLKADISDMSERNRHDSTSPVKYGKLETELKNCHALMADIAEVLRPAMNKPLADDI